MNRLNKILVFATLIITFACSDQQEVFIGEYMKSYPELHEKQFHFPKHLVPYNEDYPSDAGRKKVLTFLDAECGACIETLQLWEEQGHVLSDEADILFLVYGNPGLLMGDRIKKETYPYAIKLDSLMTSLYINSMEEFMYKTVLLSENNQVLFAGDPIKETELLPYYNYLIEH